jgi:hypothetical protein
MTFSWQNEIYSARVFDYKVISQLTGNGNADMKHTVQQAFDTQLLQRVSLVRVRMGLESLPSAISVSEIDPLLQFFLFENAKEEVDPEIILQQEPWLSMLKWGEKWKLQPDWKQWDKVSAVEINALFEDKK